MIDTHAHVHATAFDSDRVEVLARAWAAVILSFVYLLSVGPIGLGMRLLGKDPLDRSLRPEPTFWRAHEPNPLGPRAAVRHQF